MSCWSSNSSNPSLHGVTNTNKKLKGVRRRKWGKWVSEIRVPGTQERLWLGTYSTAEAAAVAHDVAVYCLRRPSSLDKLNFPETLSSYDILKRDDMSPKSVQKVASDVGMDVDARNIAGMATTLVVEENNNNYEKKSSNGECDLFWLEELGDVSEGSEEYGCREGEALNISVEDYL
ncbi:unnamed protein product [Lupinus luteus]|uniref:AP2/ERF domain-containing protein n=1 Tax=Lupinus luteus TaxID=3873 RepID=A0AAV1YDA0_LUPLU